MASVLCCDSDEQYSQPTDGHSSISSISPHGCFVTSFSNASILVGSDTNGTWDIVVAQMYDFFVSHWFGCDLNAGPGLSPDSTPCRKALRTVVCDMGQGTRYDHVEKVRLLRFCIAT